MGSRSFSPGKQTLPGASREVRYCGGLVVLGCVVPVPEWLGLVLGRGAEGTPAAGCGGTPDLAL